MSLFEEPEWGSSKVFSYYESPGAANFLVSSSVLETSLQKEKSKGKQKSGEVKRNKKRKLVEEGTGVINDQKKKKQKFKDQGEKISQSINLKNNGTESEPVENGNIDVGKGQVNTLSADSSSKKKKQQKNKNIKDAQKKLITSLSNSAALESKTGENEASASISSPKTKKKKNKNINDAQKKLITNQSNSAALESKTDENEASASVSSPKTKKKKNKKINDAQKKLITSQSNSAALESKTGENEASASIISRKKKKKINDAQKKLITSQSSSTALESITDGKEDSASISSPKKKKKKNVCKRNKYKELNAEQNKKKNTLVNGVTETPLKTVSSVSLISNKTDDEHIKNGENEVVKDVSKSPMKKEKRKKEGKDGENNVNVEKPSEDNEVVKDVSKSPVKKEKRKKKGKDGENNVNVEKPSEDNEVVKDVGIAMPVTFKKDTDGSGKDVGKSPVNKKKHKKKGKGGENNVNLENPSEDKSEMVEKTNLNLGKEKLKTSNSKVDVNGSEKKKKGKKRKGDLADKNKNDEDEDMELGHDVESYLKELNFDKLKNGIPFDVSLLSDDEEESYGKIDESGDEYVEDELPEEKEIPSKTKAATKNKAVKNKPDKIKVKPIKVPEGDSDQPISERKDKVKQHSVNKFDKNILNRLLQEAEPKENKEEKEPEIDSKESTRSAADALREKMTNQLNAARFRIVNEQMYTATSSQSVKMFKSDPNSFTSYHSGFQSQVARWPMNPLDLIIKWLANKPKHWVVADFGCGEATLAASVPQKTVHSFDLMAVNSRVTVCDMSHTSLSANSVDAVVFCLSLMGTNIKDFILEANRVLKEGGIMKIAEVESRFSDVNYFVNHIKKFGFHCVFSDTSTKYFYMFEFKKHRSLKNKSDIPNIILKPCKYKKR